MKKTLLYFLCLCLLLCSLSSCVVSKKKFEDEVANKERVQKSLSDCNKTVAMLKSDTTKLGAALREALKKYGNSEKNNKDLVAKIKEIEDKYKSLDKDSKAKISSTQQTNEQLAAELRKKEEELAEKERLLAEREKVVKELQDVISRKDAAAKALLDKIKGALSSFNSDELSVELKNGLVYVSMSDKLLFKSGKTDVDAKGKEALGKLASELNKNPDIQIAIEGHTDNVPIKTAQFSDNWDLSVIRSNSILRILSKDYQVDVKRITPAGKGELFPKADNATPEGRSKNRRTEIVLSPKLDELYKLLETK
jgi:chemotaxis protein MotB